jgi:hypothetical protein
MFFLTAKRSSRPSAAPGKLLVLGLVLALVPLSACSKESKPVAEDPRVPAPSDTEAVQGDSPATAKAPTDADKNGSPSEPSQAAAELRGEVSEDSFDLKLQPSAAYKVGEPGQVEILLVAKAPFKVNQEYPYSFSLQESEGLSFASMKITKDAVKLEEKRATMTVPFTPKAAGERTVAGTFKFSVCTDEQCLIKKHDLGVAVKVQ